MCMYVYIYIYMYPEILLLKYNTNILPNLMIKVMQTSNYMRSNTCQKLYNIYKMLRLWQMPYANL
jgi:hypothetical protein